MTGNDAEAALQEAQASLESAGSEKAALASELEAVKAQQESLKSKMMELIQRCKRSEAARVEMTEAVSRGEQREQALATELERSKGAREGSDELSRKLEEANDALSRLQAELQEATSARDEAAQSCQASLESASAAADENIGRLRVEHEAAQSALESKLSATKGQLEGAEEQNATLRGKIDKLVARYRQLQESKKADRASAEKAADESREAHEASVAELRAELTLWQRGERVSESTESALAQGEATLNGLRSELESQRAIQNRANGRPASFSVEMCVRVAGELWCLVRAHRDQPSSEGEQVGHTEWRTQSEVQSWSDDDVVLPAPLDEEHAEAINKAVASAVADVEAERAKLAEELDRSTQAFNLFRARANTALKKTAAEQLGAFVRSVGELSASCLSFAHRLPRTNSDRRRRAHESCGD